MTDLRFDTPIFTIADSFRHLAIPETTVARWMGTSVAGKPLVHRLTANSPQAPSVPFVAVVEAFVLRLLRERGMKLQDISTAVRKVRREIGSEYALASKRITTDGVDVIIDVGRELNMREWVRARDDQAAFREVAPRTRSSLFLESVLDLLPGLLEVGLALVALALRFERTVAACLPGLLLELAGEVIDLVAELVVGAHGELLRVADRT